MKFGIDRVVLIYQEIEGVCEDNIKLVNVTHEEVRKPVEEMPRSWVKCFPNFVFTTFLFAQYPRDFGNMFGEL